MTEQNRNRKAIVGLGLTGLSCARYLHGRGEDFKVMDSRENPPGLQQLKDLDAEIEVKLGAFEEADFMDVDTLIMSPGVDPRTPAIAAARARGLKISGDVDLFSRQVAAPIVAITGSNAKSTVVTLVGEMAREAGINVAVGGNIGTPVLDLLEGDEKALYVLELSSFQLETTESLNAEVATILNVSMDHMDRYPHMQAYLEAKQKIFRACRQVVINRDDPLSRPPAHENVTVHSYGLDRPAALQLGIEEDGEMMLVRGKEILLPASELKMAGRHNLANALAALALGTAVDIPMSAMLATLRSFPGLPHRCQWVAKVAGVDYYNDSKGTNTGACIAAIEGLADKGEITLIAGGQGKGGDFSVMRDAVNRYVKRLILIGEDAPLLARELEGCSTITMAPSLEAAVAQAAESAAPGAVVLLSPGCASFDMFSNYQHRGQVFMDAVRELQI